MYCGTKFKLSVDLRVIEKVISILVILRHYRRYFWDSMCDISTCTQSQHEATLLTDYYHDYIQHKWFKRKAFKPFMLNIISIVHIAPNIRDILATHSKEYMSSSLI